MFKEEFMQFIRDNVPVKIGEGFIVIKDTKDNQSFHVALYRFNEIFN
jgi:hypothetical protein